MGIDYSPVLGVGVDSDKITYDTLTEYAKQDLIERFIDNGYMEGKFGDFYDDELIWDLVPKDELEQALEDYYEDVKFGDDFLYDLGLCEREANHYSGWHGNVGVGIRLNIDTIKEDVDRAALEFKKVVNLEPELFSGVLIS